jgi:hypothetical protein
MVATTIHEVAHNIDDGVLVGSGAEMSEFREFGDYLPANDPSLEYYRISWEHDRLTKDNSFFCSHYGKTDPFEDFAECFTIYVINGAWFKEQGEGVAKYNHIKRLFGGREFLAETAKWSSNEYATTRAGFTISNIFY